MRFWISVLMIVFLLTACTSTESESNSEPAELEKTTEELGDTGEKEVTEKENHEDPEEKETDKEETDKEEENNLAFQIQEKNWTVQPVEETDEKRVLITIDDAPDTYSVEMAEFLAEENVPAIFFVNGHFLKSEEGKKQLKTIYELGFEIGNHTMSHANLRHLSEEETTSEIIELNELIEGITGETPTFFRAPFGINTEHSKNVLEEENMIWMNWTYGYDWEQGYMEAEALADVMVNSELLTNGANLLMHDREWTNEALPDIIKGFREKGYDFIDPAHITQ